MEEMEKKLLLIKDSVRKLYSAQLEKKNFDKYYDEIKKKEQVAISNFMFTHLPDGQNSFDIVLDEGAEYYTNHKYLTVTRVRRKKVTWNLEKLKTRLKEHLKKYVYDDIVDKTYIVNDMPELIKYLKNCNVDPKIFKKFIDVEEKADEKKINNYYDLGVLENKDITGCYDVEISEPYIMIKEK